LFGVAVGQRTNSEITRVVVTTLGVRSLTLRNGFQEFINEHPITPAAIIIQESQRTDRLMESSQVTCIEQETLSGNQCLARDFKSTRLSRITRICGACVTLLP
jgi:hypothetical protein